MPNTISANMGLIVPGVGTELGPAWANDLNADLGILDQHNHSTGQGVPISPNGLDINADLSIQSHNLTLVKTVNFDAQSVFLPGTSPNLGCLYVAGNELYYNDEAGNVVPITLNGSVNAGAGSITGLPSGTASASYSSGSKTFVWQSSTSTPANMDCGSVIIREVAASAKGITLSSPTSLVADYSLTLPGSLPAGVRFLTVDNSGNVGDVYNVDNSTIEVSSNLIQVKDSGITNAKVADSTLGIVKFQSDLRTPALFTVDGTFTVPDDVTYLRVLGCGGGGGGSGAFSTSAGGGGGGAGVFEGILEVVPGEILTIVIGLGGLGSATNAANPNIATSGSDSTITGSTSGLLLTMSGGQGAQGGPGGSGIKTTHNGQDGVVTVFAANSGGAGYKDALITTSFSRNGNGGSISGNQSGGGGGSIGTGGNKGTFSPLSHPQNGGIGAGGGGQDATGGYFDTGGTGGNGQVTIYVL